MNAWKPKKTIRDYLTDAAQIAAATAMWCGMWIAIFAFA